MLRLVLLALYLIAQYSLSQAPIGGGWDPDGQPAPTIDGGGGWDPDGRTTPTSDIGGGLDPNG